MQGFTGMGLWLLALLLPVFLGGESWAQPPRKRPPIQGTINKSVTGKRGRSATLTGTRTIKPGSASSSGMVTGPRGGTSTMSGSATKKGNTVSGSGDVAGPRGRSAHGEGTVTKNEGTVSGSGTVTTSGGRQATVSGSGSKEAGNVTVETNQGTSTATWDQQSATVQGPQGHSATHGRR